MKTIQAMSICLIAGILATSCGYNRDPGVTPDDLKKGETSLETPFVDEGPADESENETPVPNEGPYAVIETGDIDPKVTMEFRRSEVLLEDRNSKKLAPRFAPIRSTLDWLFYSENIKLKKKFVSCNLEYGDLNEVLRINSINSKTRFDIKEYSILESTKTDLDVLKDLVKEEYGIEESQPGMSEVDFLLYLGLEHQIVISEIVERPIRRNLVNGYRVPDGITTIAELNEDLRVNTESGATLRDIKPMHAVELSVDFRPQPGLRPERLPEMRVLCLSQAPQSAEDAIEYLGKFGKVKQFEPPTE